MDQAIKSTAEVNTGAGAKKAPAGAIKVDILKKGVSEYLSTLSSSHLFTTFVFGTNPNKKCEDIELKKNLKTSEASKYLLGLKPGTLGRTPLAKAIKDLIPFSAHIARTSVLILTDGSDTCGQDPCAALKELDQKLNTLTPVKFDIIGFDLDSPENDLKCFKDLKGKLRHIDINILDARNASDLMQSLATNQSRVNPSPGWGNIRVVGAPADAEFKVVTARPTQLSKTGWKGTFTLQVPIGRYLLSLNHPGTHKVSVEVGSEKRLQIPYGDFFDVRTVSATFAIAPVAIHVEPKPETRQAHPKVSGVDIIADSSKPVAAAKIAETIKTLHFGGWTFKVLDPWWLRDVSGVFELRPNEDIRFDLSRLFSAQVVWFETGNSTIPRSIKAGENRLLLPPGIVRVPLKKEWGVEWLVH
jgi:hypothetical protein